MSSNDDKNLDLSDADARLEAHALMESALRLLDAAEEDLAAAKLDDAICALGVRSDETS